MGDLTKNFSRAEFACKCGECESREVSPTLARGLQSMRDRAGVKIIVNSGYRCPKHNAAEGGAKNSQHVLGNAADVVVEGLSVLEMYELALGVDAFRNGGIGVYPRHGNFIHVDVRGKFARWEGHGNGGSGRFKTWLKRSAEPLRDS